MFDTIILFSWHDSHFQMRIKRDITLITEQNRILLDNKTLTQALPRTLHIHTLNTASEKKNNTKFNIYKFIYIYTCIYGTSS